MSRTPEERSRARTNFYEGGIWLLLFALLVPAAFVGYEIGRSTRPAATTVVQTPTQTPWPLENGDLFKKLPAFTNAPVAVVGDTLITAASFPGGKGQTTEAIAFRLGANGQLVPGRSHAATGGTANGAALFSQNCASCHTLAAAHSHGAVGPNLDQLAPSRSVVARQVTNGGGGMPSFGGRLSKAQIAAIAAYVAASAGKK
jgi:mono/diheme cytochrome c family protein